MNNHLHNYLWVCILALALTSCAVKNMYSLKTAGERLSVRPLSQNDSLSIQGIIPVAAIAVALAPKVIDYGVKKISEAYARDSEKYVAQYGGKYVGENFYKNTSDLELAHDQFVIERYITENGKEMLASSIVLGLTTNSEMNLLTIKPLRIRLYRTKAKLRSKDQDVDLSLAMTLTGFWQTKSGDIKTKVLGDVGLVLKKIELGNTYTLTQNDGSFFLTDERGNASNYNIMSDWFAPVPFSEDATGARSKNALGNFVLDVSVTEIDDYGERVAQIGNNIADAKGIFTELIKRLLDD